MLKQLCGTMVKTILNSFYNLEYLDYFHFHCYIHNVLAILDILISAHFIAFWYSSSLTFYSSSLTFRSSSLTFCSSSLTFRSSSLTFSGWHVLPLYILPQLHGMEYMQYKGKKCHPLKVRQEELWKAVVWVEIEKSGMADHIWKETENHLPLWDEVKLIDREEHCKIRCLKEAVHMLGFCDLSTRPRWIWYGNK